MELSADNQSLAILAAANPKGAIFDAESWGFTLSQTIGNSLFQPARDGELACSGQTDWGGRDLCVVDQGLPGGAPLFSDPKLRCCDPDPGRGRPLRRWPCRPCRPLPSTVRNREERVEDPCAPAYLGSVLEHE